MCNFKEDKRSKTSKVNGKLGGRPKSFLKRIGETLDVGQVFVFQSYEDKIKFAMINRADRTKRRFVYGECSVKRVL